MSTPLLDNLGPIIKNTTYVPDYSINRYQAIYILPEDKNVNCVEKRQHDFTTSSARSYLYDHGTVIKNNPNNNADITCHKDDKTFLGWAPNENYVSIPEIIATSHTILYPIFVDKIPVSVYLFKTQIVQKLFSPNITLDSNNNELQTAIGNAITNLNIENFFKLENTDIKNPYKLYTDEECTTQYTGQILSDRLTLYIKGDPYVIFSVGENSNASIVSYPNERFIRIPLSDLSNSSRKTPSAIITTPHMEFSKWKLSTTNDPESPYPDSLGEDSNQLRNYKRAYSATYFAEFKKMNYTIIFKDTEGNCSPKDVTLQIEAESTINKANNTQFASLTCNKVGHTWNGWEKEEFTNKNKLCPITNLLIYIIMIIVIAYIIKFIVDGSSNSKSGGSILRSSGFKSTTV